jgi:hypothetical protein
LNVEAILFANRAAVEDWLLAVDGGGWEYYRCPFFPATVSGYVAGILTLDDSQHGELPAVFLEIFDESGQVEGSRLSMIASGTRPTTTAGVPYRVPFAIPFMTVAKGPTVMKARLSDDQGVLAVIAAALQAMTPDALPDEL